jgi:hypothetical protein
VIAGMPQNFVGCDLAWFVIDAVAELDLSAFYASLWRLMTATHNLLNLWRRRL